MSWGIPRGCGFRLAPRATSPFTPSSRLTSRRATEHSPTASVSKSAPRRAAPSPRGTKIRPFAYRDETASRPLWKREVQPAAPLKGFSILRNSAVRLPKICGALCSFNRGPFFIGRVRVDGALAIVEVAIAFHLVWLCLETIAALYLDKRRARGPSLWRVELRREALPHARMWPNRLDRDIL